VNGPCRRPEIDGRVPAGAAHDGPVDVVDVFRPADEAPKIARQAIDIGAKVLRLQEGIESQEAKRIAEAAGLTVVMNRCMGETHAQLGLGRGPG
jgi:predicted CoA-binding protein